MLTQIDFRQRQRPRDVEQGNGMATAAARNESAYERLTKMVHFVVQHTPPEKLGAVKLNKVLWFADLMYYRLHGRTISGETSYRKLQYGPVPNDMVGILADLKRRQFIAEREAQTPVGSRREFVWLEAVDTSGFDPAEIDTLRDVIEWASPMSAKEISELTHDDLWEESADGAQIPVAAAAVIPGKVSDDDLRWAEEVLSEFDDGDAIRPTA